MIFSAKNRKKLMEFLGLKKNMVAVLSMVIFVGLGEKMAERFLPLYLMALGGSVLYCFRSNTKASSLQ